MALKGHIIRSKSHFLLHFPMGDAQLLLLSGQFCATLKTRVHNILCSHIRLRLFPSCETCVSTFVRVW